MDPCVHYFCFQNWLSFGIGKFSIVLIEIWSQFEVGIIFQFGLNLDSI